MDDKRQHVWQNLTATNKKHVAYTNRIFLAKSNSTPKKETLLAIYRRLRGGKENCAFNVQPNDREGGHYGQGRGLSAKGESPDVMSGTRSRS